jgi:hypothetical protein
MAATEDSDTVGRDPRFELADAESAQKNWAAAMAILRNIAETANSEFVERRASRRLAEAARRSGDLELAKSVLRQHFTTYPADTRARSELAKLVEAIESAERQPQNRYWEHRSEFVYLYVAKKISQAIASNANVVADVGSNGTPILEWFPEVPLRYSVDLNKPYRAENIRSIKDDFLNWAPSRKVNVLTCFQVMEHLAQPELFALKMLSLADVCIVSVPYKWRPGLKYHLQDPVDEEKMLAWFGREPNYTYLAREIVAQARLIQVYDRRETAQWGSISAEQFRFRWSLRGSESVLGESERT